MRKIGYKGTLTASFAASFLSALAINFIPLLFVTFQRDYGLSLSQLALLVTVNFGTQLAVDILAAKFADKIGIRVCIVASQVFVAAGLIGLSFLPDVMSPYAGIILSVVVFSVGGGLMEVLVNPIIESCPTRNKAGVMSFTHSCYCWGFLFTVLMSSLFFKVFGIEKWKLLSLVWAALPALNAVFFCLVPLYPFAAGERGMSMRELFSARVFWMFLLLMICSGAAEQATGQWASAFAEKGLGVSKAAGDLLGPCVFAAAMGLSRALYAKFSEKIDLKTALTVSGVVCAISYLVIAFAPWAWLGFCGIAVCGLSVGILWPGMCAAAAARLPRGGTAMFALLAMCGDLGCMTGPALVGVVSDGAGGSLSWGLLAAIVFPVALLFGVLAVRREKTSLPSQGADARLSGAPEGDFSLSGGECPSDGGEGACSAERSERTPVREEDEISPPRIE